MNFIDIETIVGIHDTVLSNSAGSSGVLNMSNLESAVGSVINQYEYVGGDAVELAAKLWERIIKAHGFVDGNKRTATNTMLLFLDENGLDVPEGTYDQELADMAVAIAEGTPLENVVTFLRKVTS